MAICPTTQATERHTPMRLSLILPKVEKNEFEIPKQCPRKGCSGLRFIRRQEVSKKIVDAEHPEVTAWRYACVRCGYVFRVYPKGVSHKHISKRVNGMAVMMYLLGLSYGAVEIVLSSLGMGIGKTSVYRAVQEVSKQVPGMKRENLLEGYQTKTVGADVSSVPGYLRLTSAPKGESAGFPQIEALYFQC